jgi:hypothetical protein
MSLGGAIAGGIALKVLYDALSDSDADHNDVLENTYEAVARETTETTSIYVDHIDDRVDADGNTRQATPGTNHHPDLVVSGFADRNLVVEVETADTLDASAKSQLQDFATQGYTRVLVVPDGTVDDGAKFLEDLGANTDRVVVTEPQGVGNLV